MQLERKFNVDQYLIKDYILKINIFELLDKIRTLMTSSSQVSQKLTLLNLNIFYTVRKEI